MSVAAIAAVATTGLVTLAAAPASAAPIGYTTQGIDSKETGVACRLATIDLASGAVTPIGEYLPEETYSCASDLAFSPSGTLYGISFSIGANGVQPETTTTTSASAGPAAVVLQVHLVRFDTGTGAVTDLGAIGTSSSNNFFWSGGLAFDAAGTLYVNVISGGAGCLGDACLYRVDPANPADAVLVDRVGDNLSAGLAINCAGTAATFRSPNDVLLQADGEVADAGKAFATQNLATGALTQVGPNFPGGQYQQSLDFDASGKLWSIGVVFPQGFATGTGFVFTVDPATGTTTTGARLVVADEDTVISGLAIAPLSCAAPPVVVTPNFTG